MSSQSKFEASAMNLMNGHRRLSERELELLSRFSEGRYLTKKVSAVGMHLPSAAKTIALLYKAGLLSLRYNGPRQPIEYAITPAGRAALEASND